MHKNKTPNKIVKLVFEEVAIDDDSKQMLKVYLEPTEREFDDDIFDADDVTVAEVYASEFMGMVTAWMEDMTKDNEDATLHMVKKGLN